MIIYPEINPVAIAMGPIKIYWYGLTYLGGFIFAWWLANRRVQRAGSPIQREHIDDLIFYSALGLVLGGRVGYAVFYGWDKLSADPTWLFYIWEGGMSFHGGLLGVITALYFFCRHNRINFGQLLDFVTVLAPVGLALGRLGNFIGQELWGRPTNAPWGMIFPKDPLGLARHPSQLYQFALEGCLLFVLLFWFSQRSRPTWSVSGLFLIGYSCLRFIAEFFREPDAHIGFQAFGWLTRGQLLCIPMVLMGVWLMLYAYRKPLHPTDKRVST